MPLSFYLLKPVKRVTEYPLLMEKLLKHTPPGHADHQNTEECSPGRAHVNYFNYPLVMGDEDIW
jgi:hypothetical protein